MAGDGNFQTFSQLSEFLIRIITLGVKGNFLGSHVDVLSTAVSLNSGLKMVLLYEDIPHEGLTFHVRDGFLFWEVHLFLMWRGEGDDRAPERENGRPLV